MADPVRHFPYIADLGLPVCEVLNVPFYRDGVPRSGTAAGTISAACGNTILDIPCKGSSATVLFKVGE